MDSWYAPYAPDFRQTLSVLATVISKTPGERIVVDAGVKAISGERGLPSVKGISGLRLKALHAEHAPIEIEDSAVAVEVGDSIEIAVQYHDGTIQLHSKLFGVRNGKSRKSSPSSTGMRVQHATEEEESRSLPGRVRALAAASPNASAAKGHRW